MISSFAMKNNIIGEINNKSMLTILIHPLKIDLNYLY